MKRKFWIYWAAAWVVVLFVAAGSLTHVYASGKKAEVNVRVDTELLVMNKIIETGKVMANLTYSVPVTGNDTETEAEKEADIDAYFADSVFVGDSIMLGFQKYAMKHQDTFLKDVDILAAGSFSVHNALWPVDEKSVHPLYQGAQKQIWETISLLQSERVFLMFGMNDLNISGVDDSCTLYRELVEKIREQSPQAEINILSMTYILNGKGIGQLENNTIRDYNERLKRMAEENGWGYVDIANALADENGDLAAEYCSDDFAHQRQEAYDVWVSVLRAFAEENR